MVKGISRQVIVVHSPDPELFDQAIFILKDKVAQHGVSDDDLMRQAQEALRASGVRKRKIWPYGPIWACFGAASIGILWLISALL